MSAPVAFGAESVAAPSGPFRLMSPPMLEALLAVLTALTVLLASLPALRAYQVPAASLVVAAAAAGSTCVAFVAGRVLRLQALTSYLVSTVGLVVLLLAADGPHPGAVATAVTRGPSRLLTETLPLSGTRAALSALVILVWVTGAATSESLIRTSGRRSPGLAIPIVCFVACYGVAAAAPHPDRLDGPLLLVAVSTAAALRFQLTLSPTDQAVADTGPANPARWRSAATAVAASAALAAVLAALAPAVAPLRARPDSLQRPPPTVAPVIVDPVDAMGQLRDANPSARPTAEFSASISAPSTGYLSMADLDVYDGGQWRFAATFEPTGGRVPSSVPAAPGIADTTVRQQIGITGALPVPLLPVLDRPQSITGRNAVTDPVTGMLLPQAGVSGGASYTVVSRAPDLTLAGLSPADIVDRSAAAPADTEIPADTSADLATSLRFVSSLTGGGQAPAPTVAYLQSLLRTLQTREKRLAPTTTIGAGGATGGTSLSQVINAVTVARAATPEQFATFYAMVARYVGVPARVVTGFRAASTSTGQLVDAGRYRFTNRQAWTWVEIPVAGFGWVVCDPTPDATVGAAAAPPESISTPPTTVPAHAANAVPRRQILGGYALAPAPHIPADRHLARAGWVRGLALGAGLLVVMLAAIPGQAALRRRLRRRRRRAAEPAGLAVGAWLELLDGLQRAGMGPGPGATASEVAGEVGRHFGPELVGAAMVVAAAADRAVFSTRDPVPPDQARAAWDAQRELHKRINSGLDRRQRFRSALLVGSSTTRPSDSRPY